MRQEADADVAIRIGCLLCLVRRLYGCAKNNLLYLASFDCHDAHPHRARYVLRLRNDLSE